MEKLSQEVKESSVDYLNSKLYEPKILSLREYPENYYFNYEPSFDDILEYDIVYFKESKNFDSINFSYNLFLNIAGITYR